MKRVVKRLAVFVALMAMLASSGLAQPEESVRLVIDGPGQTAYLDALLPLLEGAQRSVDVLLFKMSASGRVATDGLIAAAERGVSVRVMLEHGSFASSDAANEAAKAKLEAAGIEVRFDDPDVETHAKLVLVDGRTVLLHSGNWNRPAFEQNVEIGVEVNSLKLSAKVKTWFDRLWKGDDPARLHSPFALVTVAGLPTVALLDSGTERPYQNTVASLLAGAKRSIRLLMYEVTTAKDPTALVDELIAAEGRGVAVTALFDATSAFFGVKRTATAQKVAAKLRGAGATVCFDDPGRLMHAKVVVVDGEQVVVGSSNWTGFALSYNVEADVFLRSKELARELEGQWAGCG